MKQKPDWNPDLYLRFKNERTQPSIDLVNRINISHQPKAILDIGCGPGNSSQVLLSRWPHAKLHGLDSSPSMIEKAKNDYPHQEWILADAARFNPTIKYDIVFSNATIQWIPNHSELLYKFCELLADRGVLAIQLPKFRDMPLGITIEKVSQKKRWNKQTKGCSELFTYHDYQFYYDLLLKKLKTIEMWETYYIHVLESQPSIIEWTKSAGMKPYLDCLKNDSERHEFEQEVLNALANDYPPQKNGKILFPFKRLFIVGYNH